MSNVTVFGTKGGTGKSMLACHLTVSFLDRGIPVIPVDLDGRNGDTFAFFRERGQEEIVGVPANLMELDRLFKSAATKGLSLVVDCPPTDSPLAVRAGQLSDGLLMPFRPGANDARALGRAAHIAMHNERPHGKPALVSCVNQFRQTNQAQELVRTLEALALFSYAGAIGHREAFNNGLAVGRTVWEMGEDKKAIAEVRVICEFMHKALGALR
jgi:cellulose biosynthesis protein BcsQ